MENKMTQKEFLDKNVVSIIEKLSKRQDVAYEVCDGVIITFQKEKEKSDRYRVLLNGNEVIRNQRFTKNAVTNSFLYIKNNLIYFQRIPFHDGIVAIEDNVNLPNKLAWNNVIAI